MKNEEGSIAINFLLFLFILIIIVILLSIAGFTFSSLANIFSKFFGYYILSFIEVL